MLRLTIHTIFLLITLSSSAQEEYAILSKVLETQQKINTLSYSLIRSDTFVTGDTRIIKGKAILKRMSNDTIMGFAYWGKRDDVEQETIYDGHYAFTVDHKERRYEMTSSPKMIPHYLGRPGGQMILKDFLVLDTTDATSIGLKENTLYYIVTINIPDLTAYDVTQRYRQYYIDRKSYLPVLVRLHQETLGKVQDLSYKISDVKINDAAAAYDFSSERYPSNYSPLAREDNKKLNDQLSKHMPLFEFTSFENALVTPASYTNKVLLFDFWEVWCGPCLASMPRVDTLYQKYRSKGLEVFGIMSDKHQLDAAKLLVQKRKFSFPMLVGDDKMKSMLGVNAVPTYILVNKKGIITYITEGYSETLELEIEKALK